MKKEKYIVPDMEIVIFESEDIITTSVIGDNTMTIPDTDGQPVTIEIEQYFIDFE